ncbi:hypothetical protein ACFFX0_23375 [Citricoccus parietis]|uniref:Uncharacterized protein n=1 Tax=Citricoccus parietis TaxID=592307 RepID=A0ABV5G4Y2_9MICC
MVGLARPVEGSGPKPGLSGSGHAGVPHQPTRTNRGNVGPVQDRLRRRTTDHPDQTTGQASQRPPLQARLQQEQDDLVEGLQLVHAVSGAGPAGGPRDSPGAVL